MDDNTGTPAEKTPAEILDGAVAEKEKRDVRTAEKEKDPDETQEVPPAGTADESPTPPEPTE